MDELKELFVSFGSQCKWKGVDVSFISSCKSISELPSLSFILSVPIASSNALQTPYFDLRITLPQDYPSSLPLISIGPNQFIEREASNRIAKEMMEHLQTQKDSTRFILLSYRWIENCDTAQRIASWFPRHPSIANSEPKMFLSRWFLSHHICSRVKRGLMQKWANELQITGVCFPGRPGYLYIEGERRDMEQYLARLYCFSWKTMKKVGEDSQRIRPFASVDQCRKFQQMDEIVCREGTKEPISDYNQIVETFAKVKLDRKFTEYFPKRNRQ